MPSSVDRFTCILGKSGSELFFFLSWSSWHSLRFSPSSSALLKVLLSLSVWFHICLWVYAKPGQTFSSKSHKKMTLGQRPFWSAVLKSIVMTKLCVKNQQQEQQNHSRYTLPFLFSVKTMMLTILTFGSKFDGPDWRARRATFGSRALHWLPLHYVILILGLFLTDSEVSLQYFDFNWKKKNNVVKEDLSELKNAKLLIKLIQNNYKTFFYTHTKKIETLANQHTHSYI